MRKSDADLIMEWVSFFFLPSVTFILVGVFTSVIWELNKGLAILFLIGGISIAIIEIVFLIKRTGDRLGFGI